MNIPPITGAGLRSQRPHPSVDGHELGLKREGAVPAGQKPLDPGGETSLVILARQLRHLLADRLQLYHDGGEPGAGGQQFEHVLVAMRLGRAAAKIVNHSVHSPEAPLLRFEAPPLRLTPAWK
jgi:hypothetical protein